MIGPCIFTWKNGHFDFTDVNWEHKNWWYFEWEKKKAWKENELLTVKGDILNE